MPALDRGRLADFKVRLHPSVFILSSAYPVVSIWEANQAQWVAPFSPRGPETTLIARPYIEVGTRRLAPGNAAFFACLESSSSIGEVVEGWRCRVRSVQPLPMRSPL